ncbi:hypothetical protein ACFLTT_02295 [Chloroflexota bacterium]
MDETRYDIKGPGLVKAIQAAVSAKKDIALVYDYDNTGYPLRVGYYFKEKGEQDLGNLEITWFTADEIQINAVKTAERDFKSAFLDLEFTHPRRNERHFLLFLTLDKNTRIILRNLFRLDKKSVAGFVMQIEIRIVEGSEEIWEPIIRYDQAHGFLHRDMINYDGHKTKHELGTQDVKEAITFAIEEIRRNLNQWLSQLGYKPIPDEVLAQPQFKKEMEKAKSKLLELYYNPDKLDGMQSTFGQLKEHPDYEVLL